MTRENKLAAPSAARRAASLLTGGLMLAGLAGCSGDLFQNSDNASLTQKAKPAVALSAGQGVPQTHASKVDEQLAASIKAKGIVLVDAKDAQYILKPTYVAATEKKGTKVAYTIDVTDKAGNTVRTISGEEIVSNKRGGDKWKHLNDEGIQKVALKSATDVALWVENPNAPQAAPAIAVAQPATPVKTAAAPAPTPVKTAAAQPAAPKVRQPAPAAEPSLASAIAAPAPRAHASANPAEVVAVVSGVTGAPGDGKTSLTEAMKRALNRQGIKLLSSATPGSYKIQGQVEMGAAQNGQQPITIRWVVVDPTGKQLEKTVVQNNKINAGMLDGPWGEIADQAAGAAAAEVTKLLSKSPTGQAQAGNGTSG
ncbi:hypothetical protein JDN40_13910 [Rhodomicrobium vannielii ATCC 17100]|uniref:hypothetical protein n=1 Tax=Rhodomicrobium vannielii TaxID=1069 RepID=UPI00191887E8|nr:hypothetical protein [Rhodomicrobium vannielii]MBJ7535205.1 hypothetical protein [Rhodomicrobium vannielii ATCC 17100]